MLLPALVVTFTVTVAFMMALRPLAKNIGLVDKPGGRKSHKGYVPIIGGVAMYFGIITGLALLTVDGFTHSFLPLSAGLLVVIGLLDDRYDVKTSFRFVAQLSAVILMVFGAGLSLSSIGDHFGTGEISMGRFTLIFTMLVTLSMINAYNLIDGADGLAGSLALLALLSIAAVAGYGHPVTSVSLVLCGAIAGFLIFNFPSPWNRWARTFMGDAGSTLLGFSIVWVTLGISQGSDRLISPVHCLWFLYARKPRIVDWLGSIAMLSDFI